MTKLELITRIIDSFFDFNTCPFDFEDMSPINQDEAREYLADARHDEVLAELTEDEKLPADVTPALYMEAYNCYIRMMKHECTVLRLSKYIEEHSMVCEYENYYGVRDGAPDVFPTDFLYNEYNLRSLPMKADHPIDVASFIQICRNSSEFNPNDEFCYYDKEHNSLVSTNNPFADGIYSARDFAEFILSDEGQDALDYIFNDIMDEDDQADVFRTDLFQLNK